MVGKQGEKEEMTDVLLCCCCQRFAYENNYENTDRQLFLFSSFGIQVENQLRSNWPKELIGRIKRRNGFENRAFVVPSASSQNEKKCK